MSLIHCKISCIERLQIYKERQSRGFQNQFTEGNSNPHLVYIPLINQYWNARCLYDDGLSSGRFSICWIWWWACKERLQCSDKQPINKANLLHESAEYFFLLELTSLMRPLICAITPVTFSNCLSKQNHQLWCIPPDNSVFITQWVIVFIQKQP